MRCVSLYHKETGHISGHMTVSDERHLAINIPTTHDVIEGHHDANRFKVDVQTKRLIECDKSPEKTLCNDREMQAARVARHLDMQSISLLRDYVLGKPNALERLQDIDEKITSILNIV